MRDLRQLGDRIEDAGRRLGVHDGDRVVIRALQRMLQHVGRMTLAERHFEHIGLQAAGDRDPMKALTEGAIDERQHLPTRAVANRSFHQSRCRRRRDVHGARGAEHVLEAGRERRDQLLHRLAAMPDHGPRLRGENLGTNFRWTWKKKLAECHDGTGQGTQLRIKLLPTSNTMRAAGSLGGTSPSASTSTGASDGVRTTASAASITSGRSTTPANATNVSAGGHASRSVAPSPTSMTGRGSSGIHCASTVRFPPDRASGELSSNPAYSPFSSKCTSTAATAPSGSPSASASGTTACRMPPEMTRTSIPSESSAAIVSRASVTSVRTYRSPSAVT